MVTLTDHVTERPSNGDKYDVFISFRGVDTRLSFTNHLHTALLNADLKTFLDDDDIESGEDLKPELGRAIKGSRASIIVLSKNYASSTWCLDELVLILEQRLISDQIVVPIFYHVDPTHVRKQEGTFGEAIVGYEHRMEAETILEKRSQWAEKIDRWKTALTEVAGLKGKNVRDRKEAEFIEELVTNIHRRIGGHLPSTLPFLFGMEDSINFIASWLKEGSSHKADILTILGMGGIGKTSLARYVYGLHCRLFDKSSFIEGINEKCGVQVNGLLDLQKQLFGDISKASQIRVHDVSEYTSKIEKAITRRNVFIVLDDIGSVNQLQSLLGTQGFHPGSKIIITTKDLSLTEKYASTNLTIQPKITKHSLGGLHRKASLQLLSHHAFMSNGPKEGYEQVSEKLMAYCDGHPLALKVLGESLHNQDLAQWEDCIIGLKEETDSHIKKALQVSFDYIPSNNDKELFKHIACFFVGMDKELTETILNACSIRTLRGIRNLTDRCLLTIGPDNRLMMHRLLQEIGRDVVRQESPTKPWKRSRLWCHEDSYKVLELKKGKNVLGLVLDTRMLENRELNGSFELKPDALSKMKNLMLLQLNYVQIKVSSKKFPKELRWLCMQGFPLESIPSDLPMENLVVLDMSYSNIKSFGMFFDNEKQLESRQKLIGSCSKDKRLLGSLKILDLSFCEQLHTVSGFVELPALERLILRKCTSLIKVCESIEKCVDLVFIDMSYCHNLGKPPRSLGELNKVKTLLLDGINSQTSSSSLMLGIPIDKLKPAFTISLPQSLITLSLKGNNLFTESFPVDFSSLSMLKDLYLDSNPIVSMPECVGTLPRLETLTMYDCKMLTSVKRPPRTLKLLSHNSYSSSSQGHRPSLQKIVFDPEMSPLLLLVDLQFSAASSPIEIEGILKIQPMAGVEETLLRSLGWSDSEGSQSQMYYEFGIFSTVYGGIGMPYWIMQRWIGRPSISFTIPSSSKKLRGLNFCYVQTLKFPNWTFQLPDNDQVFVLPLIRISNNTKKRTWIYKHCIESISVDGKCLIFLSFWMFGMNEMDGGDHVTITVTEEHGQFTRECGIGLVYDDDESTKEEEENKALRYYKSWNHVIGGDLSAFQVTTGEYVLYVKRFLMGMRGISIQVYRTLMENDPAYTETNVQFRAFST